MSGGNAAIAAATDVLEFSLAPADCNRLLSLCGECNNNLVYMEKHLGVRIQHRGHTFRILGDKTPAKKTAQLLQNLYGLTKSKSYLEPEDIHLNLQKSSLQDFENDGASRHSKRMEDPDNARRFGIRTPGVTIEPRSDNQIGYISNLRKNAVQFATGPAGTGKTFLAVACALESLQKGDITHICLVRPAVGAGETLGYLPGTLVEKIDPYLRPLYDALQEMLGTEKLNSYMEKNVIEVGALAYMRGRTLNHCFAILDEGQNCSPEQIKMFLTRLGFNSKAVITGDLTQIDLQPPGSSGLAPAIRLLEGLQDIGVARLDCKDIFRHPVVSRIIEAYDAAGKRKSENESDQN